MRRLLAVLSLVAVLLAGGVRAKPLVALPVFAHQYGLECNVCHSVVPHLTEFGAAFLANGYRLPGVKPQPAFPIAGKINLVGSSERPGPGLPKAVVDELELFTAGAIGSRSSYLVEEYAVDGGMPGLLRDAWVMTRLNPWEARIPVYAQAGSFTLPLPVDPETFRDTYADYAPFVQAVGGNPFNFKDPKIGLRVSAGDLGRGSSVQLFAGWSHDRDSALPANGTDWMGVFQHAMGNFAVSAYRYEGSRPSPIAGGAPDRFSRTGYALTFDNFTRWEFDNVLQTGWDSNCSVVGYAGCASSGGFTQARYMFDKRLFALARYEGTNDPTAGFARDAVVLIGYGPTQHSRITLEDVIAAPPSPRNTINLQVLLAY